MSKDNQSCTSAHHRVLKCVVLLVILKLGDSLKLTPVQNQSRKLELDQETKSISAAFSEARELISNEPSVISESHAKYLLQNHVMKKLHSSIERWNSIEDRLRSVILTTDQKQVSMFDEALSVIAASRVMLGQLFWRSREDAVALKELEPSCPILWEYDVAKTSLDSDGWLDCYSSLGDIYIRMGRLEQAVEQEKDLIARMPWLALTFSGKPTNTKLRTLATILHLTRVTGEERRMISVYIKNAWRIGESLRAQLNELVSEFVAAETDKRRMNIYIRTKNVIEEALQRFVQDSNVSILHYSSKSRTETTTGNSESNQIANGESSPEDSTLLSSKDTEIASESTAQTRKRESTLLNSALRIELNREASYYLHTMDGIIEGGKHFLPAVRIREQARALDRFQSTNSAPPGRENPFGLNDPSATSITSAPMGFQSRDQVMQVFEYFLAHRAQRLEQMGNAKQSATAERFARRAASAPSSSNKKSSTTSQSQTKKASGESRRSRSTHFTNETNSSPLSEQSYGFIGMIIAIFAGSGYMMRNAKHSQKHSSSNSTGRQSEKNSTEDKESGHALWALLISLIGLTATSKILKTWGKAGTHMSHLTLKITAAFSRGCQRTHVAISPLLLWCRRTLADRQSRIHREERALTAWTNTCKSTNIKPIINGSSSTKKQASQKIAKAADRNSPERCSTNKSSSSAATTTLKNDIPSAGHENRASSLVTQKKQAKSKKRVSKAISGLTNSKEGHKALTFSEAASADSIDADLESSSDADEIESLHHSSTQPKLPVVDTESSSRSESNGAPSSPSSVTNTALESTAGYFSEDRIFDDSYWRSIDEEEEGEGAWIETSSQLLKGKSKRTRGIEKQTHETTSSSQRPMRSQHDRKALDTAFSSSFGNPKDRHVNNTSQSRRAMPSRRPLPPNQSSFNRPTQNTPHNPSTTASGAPLHRPVKESFPSAPAVIRPPQKEQSRTLQPIDKPTQSTDNADFPPLQTAYPVHGHSMGSSVENSTDMEDHSSISDDSHLSTPRSRSLSTANFHCDELEENQHLQMAPQQTHSLHPMQIPYYPVGYMPMQMSDMSQMMYDPSMSMSPPTGLNQFIMPPVALSQEQIQALGQHQQSMMMMPYPPMYMIPHPQYDPMLPAPIMQHMMNPDEQVLYNVQANNQIYYEPAINQAPQSGGPVSMEHSPILSDESYIVDTVRQQIEYYFSKTNLLHDKYLRSKMDPEGFVGLSEIANWNRIRRIGATPHMILQAVQTSNSLEIMEHWEVAAVRGNSVGTYALAPEVVLSTLIRCAENPLSWIPEPPVCVSENCVTSAESVEHTANTPSDQ